MNKSNIKLSAPILLSLILGAWIPHGNGLHLTEEPDKMVKYSGKKVVVKF